MKTVFIITRHEADGKHTDERNMSRARYACDTALRSNYAPICTRLFYDTFWDEPSEAEMYRQSWEKLMEGCDKVWVWGASLDGYMQAMKDFAARLGKPVETYNSIGVIESQWNSVKYGDDPGYQAACREAGIMI